MTTTSLPEQVWLPRSISEPTDAHRLLGAELEPCGHAMILHAQGRIDGYTSARWQHILDSALIATSADGGGYLIVDTTDIDFLSLRAILAIIEHCEQGCRRRIAISVVDPRPRSIIARILTLTGLTSWLPVFADQFDALVAASATNPRP
ncbi:STAS domain-containing protein [Nocardia rhizosphaerihabitans]|uniref:STAS domain-containing protein n=1 Tax=Nocardia rhizosphaerihabitans TaxID=1691570 RepID=UPI00366E68D6